MNKQEVYDFLKQKNIPHEITEHKAVFSMEELTDVVLPYPECDAKNLLVRDDKRRNYYLITVKGNKRADLKEFRKKYETKSLTFANPDELMELFQVAPGHVSPFGLLNDKECKVEFYLDSAFQEGRGLIGCHPNDNTATVWLDAKEMFQIAQEHGNLCHWAEI